MEKFDFISTGNRKREIGARLEQIADKLGGQIEANERETLVNEESTLKTEFKVIEARETAALIRESAAAQPIERDKNAELREILQSYEGKNRVKREISLNALNSGDKNNMASAGAINLTINDLLPELDEGLIFGKVGLKVQTGVKGNIIWPYATSVVTIEEVGEAVSLTDQAINFDKIEVSPKRLGATIAITNEAIDDASFDLLGYVQEALTKAMQRQLNFKTFSFDSNITGMKGPFAGKTSIGTIPASYKALLNMKAGIIDAGVDISDFCWVLDAHAEALLKATPKADGQGGFVIQDGKLDGDPYFVSHFIRKGASAQSSDMYIGCGAWSNLAANQHGDVRLVIDPYTNAVKNETVLTLNTRWSLTTLRDEAFAISKLSGATPGVFFTSPTATVAKTATVQLTAYASPSTATIAYTSGTTAKATVNASTGLVTGVAAGTSVITATITVDGQTYTDTCTVTVTA